MTLASKKKKIFDGRYEVLSIVGRGSCSVVYHARHAMTQSSEVALKVLLNQKKGSESNTDRLRKEALAMVSSRHKFVVRLDDFHSVKDLCYLSMEYAREGDLRKYSQKLGGRLTVQQAELFFLQSAEALNFVHRVGITHRDIKPDNILVMNDKEIRLADFGVAVLPGEHASLEDLRSGVGTMSYMAPEVLEGRLCDKLSDMYALAVTFYELLSGVHPFENAPLIKQLEIREDRNITPINKLVPSVPKNFAAVLMKAMSYNPPDRFASMTDLLKAMNKSAVQGGQGARESAPAKPAAAPANRERKNTGNNTARTVVPQRSIIKNRQEPQQQPAPPPENRKQAPKTAAPQPEPRKTIAPGTLLKAGAKKQGPPEQVTAAPETPQPASDTPAVQKPAPKPAAVDLTSTKPADSAPKAPAAPQPPAPAEPAVKDDLFADDDYFDFDDSAEQTDYTTQSESFEDYEPAPSKQVSDYKSQPVKDYKLLGKNGKKTAAPARRKDGKPSPLYYIMMTALILFAGNYILTKFAGIDLLAYLNRPGEENTAYQFTPASSHAGLIAKVSEPVSRFPALPAGLYNGSISGLLPDTTLPFSVISVAETSSLAFLIGLDGWTPQLVSFIDRKSDPANPQPLKRLRVASNGIVLDFTGTVEEGAIKGTFTNAITGERGQWLLKTEE